MLVDQTLPEAYCLDVGLQGILIENHPEFDILWYHWPRDGIYDVEDFEPVIRVYREQLLCAVIVRRGWAFKTTDNLSAVQNLPLRIHFDPLQHHPVVASTMWTHQLYPLIASRIDAPLISIDPSEISEMYRTGLGHPSGRNKVYEDPSIYAQRRQNEFCS